MKHRNEFIWGVRNAYEDLRRMSNVRAVVSFILFSMVLAWFLLGLESVLTLMSRYVVQLVAGVLDVEIADTFWAAWGGVLLQALVPTLALLLLLLWLRQRYVVKGAPPLPNLKPPREHEGLIFLLGPYRPRGDRERLERLGVPATAAELEALLDDTREGAWEGLRDKMLASTWGPLWVAVEHHGMTLQHCWLVSTEGARGSKKQVALAERLVQAVHPRREADRVACHDEYVIGNVSDVSVVVRVIRAIYRDAIRAVNLEEAQVIADFTGGTAAMTAGLILATLDHQRKIQYLRQDKDLWRGAWTLTKDQILLDEILVAVETSRKLVPDKTEEEA